MFQRRSIGPRVVLVVLAVVVGSAPTAGAEGETSVSGTLTANGSSIKLPFVYVWALEKGFYDDNDPAWKILFVERAVPERELGEMIWDAAFVEIGITRTAEFGEGPELQVYSQNLRLAADAGNISGGTYPNLELESTGPERFAGRVFLPEPQEFFDDTFQYDFTFSAPLSNPEAPIGDTLPAGGGEPGAAYLEWVAAVHSGDLARIKAVVPDELAAQLDGEDATSAIELLAAMTPTDVTVLGGSSDGQTAVLEVEGAMDGEKARGEVTLEKMGGIWVATKSSW